MTFYLTCSQIHTRPWGLIVRAVQIHVMFPVVPVWRRPLYLIATAAVLDVCVAAEVQ